MILSVPLTVSDLFMFSGPIKCFTILSYEEDIQDKEKEKYIFYLMKKTYKTRVYGKDKRSEDSGMHSLLALNKKPLCK